MAKSTETCGVCLKPIKSAYSPGKCPSWGKVKIGGAWVSVHHTCYYGKKAKAA